MATPKDTLWPLDPHTLAKHEILKRYLGAWFPIISKRNRRIVYIDGFSGPGRYQGGELGSPIIALEVARNHRKPIDGEVVFWFVEGRADRLEHLQQELAQIEVPAHFKVSANPGRFEQKFEAMLDSIDEKGKSLAPAFAFIDPFGFSGIPFELIERLMGYKSCEAFINFAVDPINRFLDHPDEAIVQHIVEAFGTDEVRAIAKSQGDRIYKLRELYQSRLKSVAKYVRYFEMRDKRNRAQYLMFFASNDELGHLKMKEAMWRVDPYGDFSFSDATAQGQSVLFGAEETAIPQLAETLRKRYTGQANLKVLIMRKFVENETSFLAKHMKAALRQEETENRIMVSELKSDGKRRRKGSFPDEVTLKWV